VMKCVRCLNNTAGIIAAAPDGSNAWAVFYCNKCNFSWRSSEEPEVIDPEKRDSWFQLNNEDLKNLVVLNPIPPLRKD